MPSNHVILCRPLLLPSIFPSMRVFSSESALGLKRPKYWSFSISISLSTEYSGLISFGMDGCDLLGGHDSEHWKVPDASIQTGPISLSPHVVFQRGLVLHPRGGAEAGTVLRPVPVSLPIFAAGACLLVPHLPGLSGSPSPPSGACLWPPEGVTEVTHSRGPAPTLALPCPPSPNLYLGPSPPADPEKPVISQG